MLTCGDSLAARVVMQPSRTSTEVAKATDAERDPNEIRTGEFALKAEPEFCCECMIFSGLWFPFYLSRQQVGASWGTPRFMLLHASSRKKFRGCIGVQFRFRRSVRHLAKWADKLSARIETRPPLYSRLLLSIPEKVHSPSRFKSDCIQKARRQRLTLRTRAKALRAARLSSQSSFGAKLARSLPLA